MRDPLTRQEKKDLIRRFIEEWEKKYQQALRCGALPELEAHDHRPAKYCLILAAEQFGPVWQESERELDKLRKFI